jgi:hypothetical protein
MIFSKAARKFVLALTAFTTILGLASANDWDYGDHKLHSYVDVGDTTKGFLKPVALRDSTRPVTLMRSPRLLAGRGGVICEGTAVPARGLAVDTIDLKYDATRPDGQRLVVEINGKEVKTPKIMDWQLIPTVSFADSADKKGKSHVSIVTLTGEVQGAERPAGALICNLHPAYENKRVGFLLTLLDYGVANLDVAGKLPSKDGKPLVDEGHGLSAINKDRSEAAAKEIRSILKKDDFSSYLIYDRDPFSFDVKDGRLTFQGKLHCFFWRPDLTFAGGKVKEVVKEATGVGEEFNKSIDLWRDLNPAVFDNAMSVFNYTNLFRYAKSKNPENWAALVATVGKVEVEELKTPVVYSSPLRSLMQEVEMVVKSMGKELDGLPLRDQLAAERRLDEVDEEFGKAMRAEPDNKKVLAAAKVLREGRPKLEKARGSDRVTKGVELLKEATTALKD